MPYKLLLALYGLYSLVYTFSFVVNEIKNKKILSASGTVVLILFSLACFFAII